jgi:hypothetical protein
MSEIRHFVADPINPYKKYELVLEERSDMPSYITDIRNDSLENIYSDEDPSILDFYNTYDPDEPDNIDRKNYQNRIENMADDEINLAKSGQHYYEITFENIGGNPMPAIVQLVYDDGSTEDYRYPAEIWRYDNTTFKKIIQTDKIVKQFILDPYLETADVDRSNNYYPKKEEANRFQLYKERQMRRRFEGGENPMQRAKRAKEIKP